MTDINVNVDLNQGIQQILNSLDKLGANISNSAQSMFKFIYPLAVKQQIVDGWVGIILGVMMLTAGIIVCFYAYKAYKKYTYKENHKENHWEDYEGLQALSIFLYIIAGVFILSAPFLIGCNISRVINPEWFALQDIIDKLKSIQNQGV